MLMITKPMLAGQPPPLTALRLPTLATPKFDGIRCEVVKGKALSRSFKPIPNDHIRNTIEAASLEGCDGELITYHIVNGSRVPKAFCDISGDVRRQDGRPDFTYHVFDHVEDNLSEPYALRIVRLNGMELPGFVEKVLPKIINSLEELTVYEAECIANGYEGVCVRSPESPYKCGRSTTGEGYLLKIKQFLDSEAIVMGVEEMMHNDNPAMRDAFGRTERSAHKSGLRPAGTMGRLVVKDQKTGIVFEIGTGFSAADRDNIWTRRGNCIGKLVKYKHQPVGAKDKPRCPVFLGFRDRWDM